MAVQTTKLAAASASRNRKWRAVCNNCWVWGTAVNPVRVVSKACVWHPFTTEAGVYQSTLNQSFKGCSCLSYVYFKTLHSNAEQ